MVFGLVAISGILAAGEQAAAPQPALSAVEISFLTHAGEGATGQKRFTRDGCYQVESGGSNGGSGYARDSQAGCLLRSDVEPVFARLAAIGADALVREGGTGGGTARGAPGRGLLPGGAETHVVLIRPDGTRWVAANQATADDIMRAVNELPSENQWYAKPPDKPIGSGAQVLVVSFSNPLGSRSEATLAADGRWWCNRSLIGPRGPEPKLAAKQPRPLQAAEAGAKLGRILKGARPDGTDESSPSADKGSDSTETAEVVWPGQSRAPLRPKRLTTTVIGRLAGEMHPRASACPAKAVE